MGKHVTAAVTLTIALALAAAIAAPAATGPSTIRITDVQVRDRTVDLGPDGTCDAHQNPDSRRSALSIVRQAAL